MQDSTCTVADCDTGRHGRLPWCVKHYRRVQRHGDPHVVKTGIRSPRYTIDTLPVLVSGEGCHLAPADAVGRIGYAYIAGKLAHRAAYEHHIGPIPAGLHIDHVCHNSATDCAGGSMCLHRRCLNPAHLEAVPSAVNVRRSPASTASRNAAKTHCPQGHPYTPENTYYSPRRGRTCKTCAITRYRERVESVTA